MTVSARFSPWAVRFAGIITGIGVNLAAVPEAHGGATFHGLGDLTGGIDFYSIGQGESGKGSVVVGYSHGSSGTEAIRWTQSGGITGLGDLAGADFYSIANAISSNGAVIVGYSHSGNGTEAFQWTQNGGMTGLGDLAGADFYSIANAASSNGAVIAGYSHGLQGTEAFRWTQSTGPVGLGDLSGGDFYSLARGISGDGLTVVGYSHSGNGTEAFRWTQGGGMVGLGDLSGSTFYSIANAVSADGAVIVGYSKSANGNEAFRWTQASGMVGLGDLGGPVFGSQARAASSDGSVIVGQGDRDSVNNTGGEAFIWDATNGMRNLKTVLEGDYGLDLTGWTLLDAFAVSSNGRTIVGQGLNPSGQHEGFIATVKPPAARKVDFNGDGIADLAVGVPMEDVNGNVDAGGVNVIYGTSTGLKSTNNQFWSQDSTGINNASEPNDHFGFALASGDFNNDGYSDLAVGVPDEDVGAIVDAGAVHVIYGSAAGLSITDKLWHQDVNGVLDDAETGDRFGSVLAVGDFNDDGFDDLAIGIPNEGVGAVANAGAVAILFGSASGLTSSSNQFWNEDSTGILGTAADGANFGASLAVGDFDHDGHDDLAIGAPHQDAGVVANAGAVSVLYGSASGLSAAGNQLWTQDDVGGLDPAESGDGFSFSLAAGDFDGDGRDDLAIGVPNQSVGGNAAAGAVNVLYGSITGLDATGAQFWTQNSAGIADQAEPGDHFGYALCTGNFDGDAREDLAIGIRDEDLGPLTDAGAVEILPGSSTGLSSTGSQFWNQDSPGVPGAAKSGATFGHCLFANDFDHDGLDDLAIGVPNYDVGTALQAGIVSILRGSASLLTTTGSQSWSQNKPSIKNASQMGDLFGAALCP